MLDIGERITKLRKAKNWSQGELADRIGASRNIIGNYERNANAPSIDMLLKIARVLEVPVDYLLGEGEFASYDRGTVKRIQDVEKLDPATKNKVFDIIDTYIRDFKTRQAYAS